MYLRGPGDCIWNYGGGHKKGESSSDMGTLFCDKDGMPFQTPAPQ
jgi:hypothetical protein